MHRLNHSEALLDESLLDESLLDDTHRNHRSVPEVCFREMHHAEPIRLAGPLRLQWWTQPIADALQVLVGAMTRPVEQLITVRRNDDRRDR